MKYALVTLVLLSQLVLRGIARLVYSELHPLQPTPAVLSKAMDNQHIVIVGDSLLRYQYLALVYLIHSNSFVYHDSTPNIVSEWSFPNWIEFFEYTNNMFYPLENCDCYRKPVLTAHRGMDLYENRYYYNERRNISVSYINYLGDTGVMHFHWRPIDDINSTSADASKPAASITDPNTKAGSNRPGNHFFRAPDHEFIPPSHTYNDVKDVIKEVAANLQPKPTTLILNAGHHAHSYTDAPHREGVLNLALSLFERVMWKTTNAFNDQTPSVKNADELVCAHPGIECLNLNWTFKLTEDDYADRLHFLPFVYNDINIQLIEQLTTRVPMVYSTMDRQTSRSIVEVTDVVPVAHFVVDEDGRLRKFADPTDAECKAMVAKRDRIQMTRKQVEKYLVGYPVNICFKFDRYSNIQPSQTVYNV